MSDLFSGEPLARHGAGPRNKMSIWKPSGRNELTNATTTPPSALRPRGLPPPHTHTHTHTVPHSLPLSSTLGCAVPTHPTPHTHTHIYTHKNKHKNTANGIAKARFNAARSLELRLKVGFVFRRRVSAPGSCTDCDEISQTIFIKANKFNMLSKEGGQTQFKV